MNLRKLLGMGPDAPLSPPYSDAGLLEAMYSQQAAWEAARDREAVLGYTLLFLRYSDLLASSACRELLLKASGVADTHAAALAKAIWPPTVRRSTTLAPCEASLRAGGLNSTHFAMAERMRSAVSHCAAFPPDPPRPPAALPTWLPRHAEAGAQHRDALIAEHAMRRDASACERRCSGVVLRGTNANCSA